jgi:ABC-type nitrate/sulfonate/bicarbonate transport system substrate-binding protein
MNRLWRVVLALTMVGALAFVVTACGDDEEPAAQEEAPAATGAIDPAKVKTKTFRIAVDNPHYLFQVDMLWAKEKGYLQEYGIDDVEINVTDNPIQAMLGGSVDAILFDTDTVIGAAAKTGEDMPVIGMYIEQEANILGAREGIDDPEQLKGSKAKIAVSGRGTRSYVKMVQMLEEAGIDPESDVELLDTGGQSNERLQQILNGTVDAGSIQLRHETILTEARGKFLIKKVYDSPQLAWATTGDLLEEDPEGVAAILAATLKARQDIVDGTTNKEAVLALMEEHEFELPQSYKDAYEVENAADYRGRDGGWQGDHMDAFIEEAIGLEVIPPDTDWREYVNVEPLWRAQKELGLDQRPTQDVMGGN